MSIGREKSIWFVHPYAGGPGVGSHYRAFEICRCWNELHGCDSRIIMPSFHHSLSAQGNLPDRFSAGRVPFHSIPVPRYQGNGLQRVIQMFLFSARLPGYGRALLESEPSAKPDFIIGSSPHPFAAAAAARLAKDCGARFVFEIRDIWPLSLAEFGLAPRWHPFFLWAQIAEEKALRSADLVASVLPRADLYLRARGFGAKPFVCVPNGSRGATKPGQATKSVVTERVLATMAAWKQEGKILMVYVGSMGPPNGIERLLNALAHETLRPLRDKLAVMLVGAGAEGDAQRKQSGKSVVPLAWSDGAVPPEDVGSILEAADFGYAGVRHRPNLYRYGVSLNKVPEYMASGLPVLLPCAPCGDPVSASGAGLAVAAASTHELAAAITKMALMAATERKAMGNKGKDYVSASCRYERIAQTYLAALTSLGKVQNRAQTARQS